MVRKFFLGEIDQRLGFRIRVNPPKKKKNAFWLQITGEQTQTDLKNKVNLFSHIIQSSKEGWFDEDVHRVFRTEMPFFQSAVLRGSVSFLGWFSSWRLSGCSRSRLTPITTRSR